MKRATFGICASCLFAVPAAAQSYTSDASVAFSLRWMEHGGNSNGVLEPGEGALLFIDVSFTNQNGVAAFAPNIGTFGSGIVLGLGSGFVDLHGSGGAQGDWDVERSQGYGVNRNWQIKPEFNGTSANGGAYLTNIPFGQFVATPQAIVTTNPIVAIWSGIWTPASYTARTVSFVMTGATAVSPMDIASVELELSATAVAAVLVASGNLSFGSVQIPIVPPPATTALLALTALAHRGRRIQEQRR
jgi:hypothetical protein